MAKNKEDKVPPSINDIISKEFYDELCLCRQSLANEDKRISSIRISLNAKKEELARLTSEYHKKSSALREEIERLDEALFGAYGFKGFKEAQANHALINYYEYYNAI